MFNNITTIINNILGIVVSVVYAYCTSAERAYMFLVGWMIGHLIYLTIRNIIHGQS